MQLNKLKQRKIREPRQLTARTASGATLPDQVQRSAESVPTQAASATRTNPGTTRRAKVQPALVAAMMILDSELEVRAARIGTTASCGSTLPEAARVATEMAAAWVSTNPPTTSASSTPAPPDRSCRPVEVTKITARIEPKTSAVFRLKTPPVGAASLPALHAAKSVSTAQ